MNDYVILKSSAHAYICAHGSRIYLTTCGGSLNSKVLGDGSRMFESSSSTSSCNPQMS
jgi:hypothetical protein